jgi:hypothetical protein
MVFHHVHLVFSLLEFLQTFIGTPWLSPRMAVGCSPWPQRREKDPKDPAVVAMS